MFISQDTAPVKIRRPAPWEPVPIAYLHQLAISGEVRELRSILMSMETDRLLSLEKTLTTALMHIHVTKSADFSRIKAVVVQILKDRKSEDAYAQLMDGVA